MDEKTSKALRAPFAPDVVGQLPRVTCRACSDNKREKHCDRHQRSQCRDCGNYITTAHMHLSYVGHAAITDRLLQVDPGWSWEPLAIGPDGLPVRDREGGLWIRLTVAGVTRLGYGDAEGKAGPSAVKEAIGDALRNGAMRFGVGLDLWHKDGPLQQETANEAGGSETGGNVPAGQAAAQQPRNGAQNGRQAPSAKQRDARPASPSHADTARVALRAACDENGWDVRLVADRFADQYEGADLRSEQDANRIAAFTKLLFSLSDDDLRTPAANGAR